MDLSSVQNLCRHLISSAYQRCRLSEQTCRLSVVLNRSSSSHQPLVQISISDTGIGSCLDEFQHLKFSWGGGAANWDGMLSVKTTSICDTEIHNYQLNLKESVSSRRTNRLPSNAKNGAKFSGTEVCLSSFVSHDLLLAEIYSYLQKMLILGIPNVAVQLVAEDCDVPESRYEKVFLAKECHQSPLLASNLECLKSGFEDYVSKHRNNLNDKCNSCFPSWEHLNVGAGTACCSENLHTELSMEAVIVISNISKRNSACFGESGDKSEVLYFQEFSPCTISPSSMKALKSIDWGKYGLNLVDIVQQGGSALLKWENLPADVHIDIVLHSYYKKIMMSAQRRKAHLERNLVKRAVKLSLDDLKEKHAGVLLSARALKISSFAPVLAKSIAGLILSSNDSNFHEECFSLLGLQSQEVGTDIVVDCIKDRIVSVIEMNDKNPQKTKEAPTIFGDVNMQEVEFEENDYEEGEDDFSPFD